MPSKEDIVIKYRPELAIKMKNHMEVLLSAYRLNPISSLYSYLSKLYEGKGEHETSELLKKASKCISKGNYWDYDEFERDYRKPLNKITYNLGEISEAGAAGIIYESYQLLIEELKDKTLQSIENVTKYEKYTIERFYKILSSPTHNPNIQVQEGHTQCYYDENPHDPYISFSKSMKFSIEFIEKECGNILNIFNTPDEELEETNKLDEDKDEKEVEI